VKRLRDPRAAKFGIKTLADVERLLNKGTIEAAGRNVVLIVKDGFEAVVNVTEKRIITFDPY